MSHASSAIAAVIFDWAGTMIDYGCFAPTMVFVDGFRQFGIEITLDEARAPMGLHKRDHIATVLTQQRVHGAAPTDAAELQARLAPIYERLYAAGARYVIDSAAELLPIIDSINARLERGEKA